MTPIAPSQPGYNAALLHHLTLAGSHFDLLLPPFKALGTPGDRLTTFRCFLPSRAWSCDRTLILTSIQGHRRKYLTYQGPISENRGRVRRVDQGMARMVDQSFHHASIELSFVHFQGLIRIERLKGERWVAKFPHANSAFLL